MEEYQPSLLDGLVPPAPRERDRPEPPQRQPGKPPAGPPGSTPPPGAGPDSRDETPAGATPGQTQQPGEPEAIGEPGGQQAAPGGPETGTPAGAPEPLAEQSALLDQPALVPESERDEPPPDSHGLAGTTTGPATDPPHEAGASGHEPAPPLAEPGAWGIVGHETVVAFLKRSHDAGRLGHAFLITGPAGAGKHALALALVRYINCQGQVRPCGACGPCRRLDHGTFVDHQELVVERAPDGKIRQGISVQQIRELTDQSVLPPLDGAYKSFAIREAELLTASAANALLKTLEEPPAHVLLLLLAPSRDAVLPTIASRCQHIALGPVSTQTIAAHLEHNLTVPADRATALARIAAGAPGIAIGLARDETALAAYGEAGDMLGRVLDGDLADRFEVAETMGELWASDRERGRAALRRWTVALHEALRERAGAGDPVPPGDELNRRLRRLMLSELAALLRAFERLPYRLDHMQPRVAFEALMLDFEATMRRAAARE